jgi:hypothetical protein
MDLTTIHASLRWCHYIPISFSLVILSPAVMCQIYSLVSQRWKHSRARHMHVVHLSTILACLKKKNLDIGIFGQTTSNDRTASPSTANEFQFLFRSCHISYRYIRTHRLHSHMSPPLFPIYLNRNLISSCECVNGCVGRMSF